jgi:hypothetical protein
MMTVQLWNMDAEGVRGPSPLRHEALKEVLQPECKNDFGDVRDVELDASFSSDYVIQCQPSRLRSGDIGLFCGSPRCG